MVLGDLSCTLSCTLSCFEILFLYSVLRFTRQVRQEKAISYIRGKLINSYKVDKK